MNRKRFRIGSVAILFAVIVLCVAIFAVLTVVTARSDLRTAEQYSAHVQAIGRCRSEANRWLAQMDALIVSGSLSPENLPANTRLEGSQISASLHAGNVTLTARLELLPGNTYRITRWTVTTDWEEDLGGDWLRP